MQVKTAKKKKKVKKKQKEEKKDMIYIIAWRNGKHDARSAL